MMEIWGKYTPPEVFIVQSQDVCISQISGTDLYNHVLIGGIYRPIDTIFGHNYCAFGQQIVAHDSSNTCMAILVCIWSYNS